MTQTSSKTSLFYGWWVVLACSIVAVFSWGLGFYGLGVYLNFLHDIHGWPTSLISPAFTAYYLVSAVAVLFVGGIIDRRGPSVVMAAGALLMGGGVIALGFVEELWQVFAVYLLVMPLGWASLGGVALGATVGPWFRRKRGLAMTLALSGPSVGGMVLVPALVQVGQSASFQAAVTGAGLAMLVILLPLTLLVIKRGPAVLGLGPDGDSIQAAGGVQTAAPTPAPERLWRRGEALRTAGFWTLVVPFCLALTVQVGFLVHQLTFLEPSMGKTQAAFVVSVTTVAALAGRFASGFFADRMSKRALSAGIVGVQGIGLALMAALPGTPWVLYAGSIAVGLGVGNIITLPALVAQEEFGAASFGKVFAMVTAGMQIGVAFGPSLVGFLRDAAGGYSPVLWVLVVLEAAAIAVVWSGWRRPAGRLLARQWPA